MSDDLNKQMRNAAIEGRTAEMNGLLDRGAEVNSTDLSVSRPSAAAGLAPRPHKLPRLPPHPLPPPRPHDRPLPPLALALGRPRRRLLSLSPPFPLQCG